MKYWQILVGISFTWVGFVSAISFMEAWLKFRAPGITLPVGLSIGRLVFNYLNKVEWIFLLLSITILYTGGGLMFKRSIIFLVPVLMLFIQSFWLLPALDNRAALQISGADAGVSHLHFYYVGTELIKVISLIIFAVKLFK